MKALKMGEFKQYRYGFTLIELLIVISIIAILAAMLLPALKNAKNAGSRAVCVNNQKQLALAVNCYTNDWNDFAPWGSYNTPPSGLAADYRSYPYYIGEYLKINVAGGATVVVPINSVFQCPSPLCYSKDPNKTTQAGYDKSPTYMFGGVVLRRADVGGGVLRLTRMTKISNPSNALLFIDASTSTNYLGTANSAWANGFCNNQSTIYELDPSNIVRPNWYTHGSGLNAAFLDGHATNWASVARSSFPLK
jgi:prepilin-type N-terminal cleavage/methylation domain-containing protein/prepilin-type processing-associated H-X9-DG protein